MLRVAVTDSVLKGLPNSDAIWFPFHPNAKLSEVYANYPKDDDNDDDDDPADVMLDKSPFHLYDLIDVSPDEFICAYGKQPDKMLRSKHTLLQTRQFRGAYFAAVIESNSSEAPSYFNIAVTGTDMSDLAAKVKASFRSVRGTADMDVDADALSKKRSAPANDNSNDYDETERGGGGKRLKSLDISNIHVKMNMKAVELLEYRLNAFTTPTAAEQAYAVAILEKMQNSSGEVSIIHKLTYSSNGLLLHRSKYIIILQVQIYVHLRLIVVLPNTG